MACQLKIDPTDDFDFLTATGANITIVVESDSGTVHLTAATLEGKALTVNGDKTSFKAAAGTNHLNLAFAAADPAEQFRINEVCGGGKAQLLTTWSVQDDPTRAFRIHAA